VVGRHDADIVEPDYYQEDEASRFVASPQSMGDYAIILRLSGRVKNPIQGFAFGRNSSRCDLFFVDDPLRRLSNIHFRIFVNEYGVVMLEDQSTNGTFVDNHLLKAKNRSNTKRMLSSGSRIKILMHDEDNDLEFLVRIPRREGEYDRAYTQKLEEYFARIDQLRDEQNNLLKPGPGGHVSLQLFLVNCNSQTTYLLV
jgi:hypothetical protein